jgi:sterol 3beta-glucosyltransferase
VRTGQWPAHSYHTLLRRVSLHVRPAHTSNRTNINSQPFWGHVVAASGAGPTPIAYRDLSVDSLLDAIQVCRNAATKVAAEAIAARMRRENGVETAVQSFHHGLPIAQLCCDILPHRTARWKFTPKKPKHTSLKLSNEALAVLLDNRVIERSRVEL